VLCQQLYVLIQLLLFIPCLLLLLLPRPPLLAAPRCLLCQQVRFVCDPRLVRS
jgi:hypothetical protein